MKKDHTGNINLIEWDKEGMRNEVEGYDDDFEINYTALAAKYQVLNKSGELAKNGGQIVKEWLTSQNINIELFQKDSIESTPPVRPRKRRMIGGEISLPTEIGEQTMKKKLCEKLESNEYTIGEMIVPRKVKVLTMPVVYLFFSPF